MCLLSAREEMQRLQSASAEASPVEVQGASSPEKSYEQLLEAFLGLDYSDSAYVRQVRRRWLLHPAAIALRW
jgi:hypothetical protein